MSDHTGHHTHIVAWCCSSMAHAEISLTLARSMNNMQPGPFMNVEQLQALLQAQGPVRMLPLSMPLLQTQQQQLDEQELCRLLQALSQQVSAQSFWTSDDAAGDPDLEEGQKQKPKGRLTC